MAFDMYSDLDHDEWEQSGRSGTNEQSSVMTVAETDPIHAPRPSPPTIQARRTLPSSRAVVDSITVTGIDKATPKITVTLTLVVDLVMAPALPNAIGSTTITRTRTVSILG